MTLLTVDIGNTSTTCGLFASRELLHSFHFPTRTLTHQGLATEAIVAPMAGSAAPEAIAIASVVPWASDELVTVLAALYPSAKIKVLTSRELPISIKYPNPEELGADRLIGSLAAFKLWGEPALRPTISIDLGTATTFDCMTATGVFLGGAIAPGIELAAEALSARAAQLPSVPLEFPPSVLGSSTVESMQSGIMFGAMSAIEGMVGRLAREVFPDESPIVIATGGLSRFLIGHTPIFDHVEPNLVLYGLYFAAQLILDAPTAA